MPLTHTHTHSVPIDSIPSKCFDSIWTDRHHKYFKVIIIAVLTRFGFLYFGCNSSFSILSFIFFCVCVTCYGAYVVWKSNLETGCSLFLSALSLSLSCELVAPAWSLKSVWLLVSNPMFSIFFFVRFRLPLSILQTLLSLPITPPHSRSRAWTQGNRAGLGETDKSTSHKYCSNCLRWLEASSSWSLFY